jgi:lipopolysaccharide assembly outer membrane protein LptD (OstA)
VPRLLLILSAAFLAIWLAPAAGAQGFFGGEEEEEEDQPFDITAESLDHDSTTGVYVARGNVRITQPDRVLTADWMTFSPATSQALATGNVVVIAGDDVVKAEVLQFRLDNLEGLLFDGEIGGPGTKFLMKGDVIQKTAESEYVFTDAEFTSCRCPEEDDRLPWKVEAKDATLDIGGYGTAKNTTFNVLGVPALWFPWMVYPLRTERATGFLFPEWNAAARTGLDIGFPFFWAVHEQVGIIIKPSWLQDNGFMISGSAEYVFGAKSSGSVFGSYIPDDEQVDPNDPSTPFDPDRWGFEWIHDHYLPYDWRWVVDGRVFSDNLYPFDFKDFSDYRKDRVVESKTFVENRFGPLEQYGFYAAILWGNDAGNPDDQDRDEYMLQRLPQLHGSVTPSSPDWMRGFVYSLDTDYTHYWAQDDLDQHIPKDTILDDVFGDVGIDSIADGNERNGVGDIVRLDGTVDLASGQTISAEEYILRFTDPTTGEVFDPMTGFMPILPDGTLNPDGSQDNFPTGFEGDGIFTEGEPLADRGHRFIVNPRLAYPFRLWDTVEVLPEIGWHGTFYDTALQGFETRNLLTAQVDVRTRMERTYDLPFGLGPALHLLEPRLQYTGVTSDSQSDNPLFTPTSTVTQQRQRQLALMNVTRDYADRIDGVNAFTVGAGNRLYVNNDEGEGTRLLADVDASLQYDFADNGLTGFVLDGQLWPGYGFKAAFNFLYDFNTHQVQEALTAFGWAHEDGHEFRISYRYVADIPPFFENFRFDDERFDEFEESFVSISQLNFGVRWAVTRNWALTYRLTYSFDSSIVLTNMVGVEYVSKCQCWAARIEVDDDRTEGFEINFRYRIIGLGDDMVRPFRDGDRRTDRNYDQDI